MVAGVRRNICRLSEKGYDARAQARASSPWHQTWQRAEKLAPAHRRGQLSGDIISRYACIGCRRNASANDVYSSIMAINEIGDGEPLRAMAATQAAKWHRSALKRAARLASPLGQSRAEQ